MKRLLAALLVVLAAAAPARAQDNRGRVDANNLRFMKPDGTVSGPRIYNGTGSPEAAQAAEPGSLYFRYDTGRIYLKATGSGNTGWVRLSLCTPGASTRVLFNDNGECGQDADFVFDKSTDTLTVTNLSGIYTGTWSGSAIAFAKGGTGLTSAADDTTLVSSGSAWVATALPNCTDTGGNHLNYTQSTNAYSCGTSGSGGGGSGGGSGALTLLESHTASSSATMDFTTCISSTYDDYVFQLDNILPATDSTELRFRVSTNGGSSYDSGSNYSWAHVFNYPSGGSSASGVEGGASVSFIALGGAVKDSNMGVVGTLRFYNPLASSTYKALVLDSIRFQSALNTVVRDTGTGVYNSNSAVNAVRLLFSSGNIASGTGRCYGVGK